jgi:hypothetical protein
VYKEVSHIDILMSFYSILKFPERHGTAVCLCRSQYTIKITIDINIDDPQQHDTSRKKLDYSANKGQWQCQ